MPKKRSKVEYVWVDYVEGGMGGRMRVMVRHFSGFHKIDLGHKYIKACSKVSREEIESKIRRLLDVTEFRWENENENNT